MRKRIARIYLRVSEGGGKQPYYPAALNKNGGVKEGFAVIGGVEKPVGSGIYYIRYTTHDGNRTYEFVGPDPQLATMMRKSREAAIHLENTSGAVISLPKAFRERKQKPTEPLSVAPLANPKATPAAPGSVRLALLKAIDDFVTEKKNTTTLEQA